MRHEFVGFLGDRIQAHRMIDVVVLGKRHPGVAAIDARAARVHEVPDLVVPAAFQDVDEAGKVAAHVRLGVLQRIAHACLRGEVDHARTGSRENSERMPSSSATFELFEPEAGVLAQPFETGLLEADVVVVVQVVDADDFVSGGKQPLRDVHTDESGRAGNQAFQGTTATWSALPRIERGASRTSFRTPPRR